MKQLFALFVFGLLISPSVHAGCLVEDHCHPSQPAQPSTPVNHDHQARHNMIVYGNQDQLFASHMIYKFPHNYQVILKIDLGSQNKSLLTEALANSNTRNVLFVLDRMNIGEIQTKPVLTGALEQELNDGSSQILVDHLEVSPENYSIIYFEELPLSLAGQ